MHKKIKPFHLPTIKTLTIILSGLCFFETQAQSDSSMSMLDTEPPVVEKVENSFKTTKVINLQSIEMLGSGVLDVKINHRFGTLNSGGYNLWGLDNSSVRLGLEYGVTKNFTINFGRQSFEKTYDVFGKYRLLHQTSDNKVPVSLIVLGAAAYRNLKYDYNPTFQQRLAYVSQIAVGRKFSEKFSLQFSGSYVHYNMSAPTTSNSLLSAGVGMLYKLTPRTTFNAEYIPVFGNKGKYRNSVSVGFDIETGGHVFQLHLTNSIQMHEAGFIARTADNWGSGGIHFGFNISRVFTVVNHFVE